MITAHQLQYSVQLLYHHLADPLGDLQAHIGLDHHLNDNQQPQITLLASASIELVSSSARITSVKFQKALGVTPGPIDRTPETPGSGKNMKNHPLFHSATFSFSHLSTKLFFHLSHFFTRPFFHDLIGRFLNPALKCLESRLPCDRKVRSNVLFWL